MAEVGELDCPSAPPEAEGARVFGVVLGDVHEPRVAYLERGVEVPLEPGAPLGRVAPGRVFRIAGRCVDSGCARFRDGGCSLGRDVAEKLEAVTRRVPACTIRETCRWFAENGPPVCLRCSRVVTAVLPGDATLMPIARMDATG